MPYRKLHNAREINTVPLCRSRLMTISFGKTDYTIRRFLQPEKRLRDGSYKYITNKCSQQILIVVVSMNSYPVAAITMFHPT